MSEDIEDIDNIDHYISEICTPPDLVEDARVAANNLLPKQSKERYERTYNEFNSWRTNTKATSFSERTLVAYFVHLATKSKPSSLWAYYSMLKSTIRLKHNIDISTYSMVTAFLKRQSEGYEPKKAYIFTEEEMKKFISLAEDKQWLAVKVVCIFGLFGAMRTNEFPTLSVSDVKQYEDIFHVTIQSENSKTKTSRSFTIGKPFYETVLKYIAKRPAKTEITKFFVNYSNGKCTKQVIGKNKFSSMPRAIAEYLQLNEPERYTGHAFRRTSATILANTGANMDRIKRFGAWKSSGVAEGYVENSIAYKKETSNMITSSINSTTVSTNRNDTVHNEIQRTEEPLILDNIPVHFADINENPPASVSVIPSQTIQNIGVLSNNINVTKTVPSTSSSEAENNLGIFRFSSLNNCTITINYTLK